MAISGTRVTRFGISGGIWVPAGSFAGKVAAPTAAAGGKYNAAAYYTTASSVTITLYDQEVVGSVPVPLDSDVCVEVGTTGVFVWDFANITTVPNAYKEYAYLMTDGAAPKGGILAYDDFFSQYLIHKEMLG
jgi:hypothetical protein